MKRKPIYTEHVVTTPKYASIFKAIFILYFSIQITLPIRHHFIQDNVLWTEEGHRLSWRMMLRSKSASTSFRVVDKASKTVIPINLKDFLSSKQIRAVSSKPDVMWQFAQRLKAMYAENGIDVAVYVRAFVGVNGKPLKRLIDPEVDLASVKWNHFKHHDWILPSNQDENN